MTVELRIKNKRAYFDYHILDQYTAGIQLIGAEIKSIRQGKANLNDAFCLFLQGILYVRNLHIAPYVSASFDNYASKRDRVLLLHKKELKRLQKGSTQKGFTIVPLSIFINKRGLAKLELALARGKKVFDKRATIRDREAALAVRRAVKNRGSPR